MAVAALRVAAGQREPVAGAQGTALSDHTEVVGRHDPRVAVSTEAGDDLVGALRDRRDQVDGANVYRDSNRL